MPLAQQVQNPVSLFAADNNGVMLWLLTVPSNSAVSAGGSLVFGIGTQANNAIGASATFLATDPDTGYFTTIYNGRILANSFIDSGSNGLFFPDANLPTCTRQFYCPELITFPAPPARRPHRHSSTSPGPSPILEPV
jgi:hypothetical protein